MPAAQARTNLPCLAWGGAGGEQDTVEALECPTGGGWGTAGCLMEGQLGWCLLSPQLYLLLLVHAVWVVANISVVFF